MRKSEMSRQSNETDIQLIFNLDGSGIHSIQTGIGFFDHLYPCFHFLVNLIWN